jgi:hypothetical protein
LESLGEAFLLIVPHIFALANANNTDGNHESEIADWEGEKCVSDPAGGNFWI